MIDLWVRVSGTARIMDTTLIVVRGAAIASAVAPIRGRKGRKESFGRGRKKKETCNGLPTFEVGG